LLGYICRISANPETCILRSADSFYKRGRMTLVIAKFLPGINTLAAPLAGSMRMKPAQFLSLDLLGVTWYVATYGTLGFLFSGVAERVAQQFQRVGRGAEYVIAIAVAAYIGYYAWLYWRQRAYKIVPRVPVEEVERQLAADAERVLIVDVRSHGYYDPGAVRIRSSIRLEPNRLKELAVELPKDKDIYLYCT
jgi:hypothetical protein